jgi:membrane-bound lytic murein transglycosylase
MWHHWRMTKRRRSVSSLALLCWLGLATPAAAQRLSDDDCMRLLATDGEPAALRGAAMKNLDAAALQSAAASAARRASEAVVAALPDATVEAGAVRFEPLCGSLAVERVPDPVLLTGYYRPLVPARRVREEAFSHPLYALPSPELRSFSRAEIDHGALDGRVPAVAWLADPIEAFFIHVQGSALLELPEGPMSVGYAGSNGRPYTSIGALLVRRGAMRQEDVSMESLKAYLREHPDQRDAILHANERYIYFAQADSRPIGSLGVALTDGRSVAADPDVYPPGTLLFIRPDAASGVGPRLAFVQDRGAAIAGAGRLDLFLGTGAEAGRLAGPLRQIVDVFVLRPK